MKIEIERKFLLKDVTILNSKHVTNNIKQGYFKNGIPRIRLIDNDRAHLCIKDIIKAGKCFEFEYSIPYDEGELLYKMCDYKIEKKRHIIFENNLFWDIDVYKDFNLITVEVELPSEHFEIVIPKWVGKEITKDRGYSNFELAKSSPMIKK